MAVAVLGGGDLGRALAAQLSAGGQDVRLWGRPSPHLEAVAARGFVTLNDRGAEADVALDVAADIGAALHGAELVVVAVPAFAQADVLDAAAPHLVQTHHVVLVNGNLGSPVASAAVTAAGTRVGSIAETAVPPFAARRAGDTGAVVILAAQHVPAAGFPASNDAAVRALAALYPCVDRAADILDAFLLNPTYVIHPALTVTNAGAVEHFFPDPGFDVQAQGTTPATRRVVDAVDAERVAVREALGYGPPHYRQATSYYDDAEEGLFGHAALELRDVIARYKKPMSLDHRYVHEDLGVGLPTLAWAGRLAGVPTPATDALVDVASALVGCDVRAARAGWRLLGDDAQTVRSALLGGQGSAS